MNQSSQPLELTPAAWIALALVAALVGIIRLTRDGDEVQTLDYLERANPVIVRSQGRSHVFPSLGIKITPPEDWTYLSLTDDVIATQPTFVNESSHWIMRLHRPWSGSWPQDDMIQYESGDATLEWIEMGRSRLRITVNTSGTHLTHDWDQVDDRSVGRLTQGDAEVRIIATPRIRKSKSSESVDRFCAAIEFIGADD